MEMTIKKDYLYKSIDKKNGNTEIVLIEDFNYSVMRSIKEKLFNGKTIHVISGNIRVTNWYYRTRFIEKGTDKNFKFIEIGHKDLYPEYFI